MTAAALRLLKPKSHHLHSLSAFSTPFPEFMSTSAHKDNLIDEAFKSSFVDENNDLKYWKTFRTRFLAKPPSLSPREAARLKYALSYKGKDAVKYAHWGRDTLNEMLDAQCRAAVEHMDAQELLSSLYGFRALKHESLYTALLAALNKEIRTVKDLNLLAIAPYIVSHSAINIQYLPSTRPKSHTAESNLAFLETIQDLCAGLITEFSDDQIAALSAGLANAEITPEKRLRMKGLLDAIEQDIVNRRMERMSGRNWADIGKAFVQMNWGGEQLFEGLKRHVEAKLPSMEVDEIADLAYHLSMRADIPTALQSSMEASLLTRLSEVRPGFSPRLALYLFYTASNNLELLKSFVNRIENGPEVPPRNHYPYRMLKTYLEAKHPTLVSEQFIEKTFNRAHAFNLSKSLLNSTRSETVTFRLVSSLLANLGFKMVAGYAYNNLGIVDFARMPEKVGIALALPAYDLIGKYEPDDRLVKQSKREFKANKAFSMRAELLRLKGWKVVEWNGHELAENMDSASAREQYMLQSLAQAGLKPQTP
jgi:hypothetical protein